MAMDKEQTAEAAKVMVAFAEGKTIQHRVPGQWSVWRDCYNPSWTWGAAEYRIKPPPVECWGLVDETGTVITGYRHREHAIEHCGSSSIYRVALLREVC